MQLNFTTNKTYTSKYYEQPFCSDKFPTSLESHRLFYCQAMMGEVEKNKNNQMLIEIETPQSLNSQYISSILNNFYGWCSDSWLSGSWCDAIDLTPNLFVNQGLFEGGVKQTLESQIGFVRKKLTSNQINFNIQTDRNRNLQYNTKILADRNRNLQYNANIQTDEQLNTQYNANILTDAQLNTQYNANILTNRDRNLQYNANIQTDRNRNLQYNTNIQTGRNRNLQYNTNIQTDEQLNTQYNANILTNRDRKLQYNSNILTEHLFYIQINSFRNFDVNSQFVCSILHSYNLNVQYISNKMSDAICQFAATIQTDDKKYSQYSGAIKTAHLFNSQTLNAIHTPTATYWCSQSWCSDMWFGDSYYIDERFKLFQYNANISTEHEAKNQINLYRLNNNRQQSVFTVETGLDYCSQVIPFRIYKKQNQVSFSILSLPEHSINLQYGLESRYFLNSQYVVGINTDNIYKTQYYYSSPYVIFGNTNGWSGTDWPSRVWSYTYILGRNVLSQYVGSISKESTIKNQALSEIHNPFELANQYNLNFENVEFFGFQYLKIIGYVRRNIDMKRNQYVLSFEKQLPSQLKRRPF